MGHSGGGAPIPGSAVAAACLAKAARPSLNVLAPERALIADRTRAALAQKKAHGAVLGNRTNLPEAQAKGVAVNRKTADAFAANVLPIVRQIQAAGATTFRALAAALNDRGVRTARGGAWHDSTVRNLLARAA